MYNIKLNVMVNDKMREAIRKIGYKKETSMSDVIRLAIKGFIENEKKREAKKK